MVAWCAIGLLSLFIPPNCKPQSTYPLLNTAASILALTNTEADQKHPAVIDGVITSSTEYGLFVQDRTAGIWVDWKNPRQFLPGDRVLVEGTSTAGLFSPDFAARRVTVIGRLPLPTPRRPNMKRLLAGDYNDQYVVITGLVRSVALRPNVSPPQRVWLKLLVDGDFIYATLPLEAYGAAEHLYGARVRIEAPASCTKNLNRQITAAMLSIPDIHHVTIVRPPPRDLFDEPETSIGGLMQYRAAVDADGRVRVRGVVSYVTAGEKLIIENSSNALLVLTTSTITVKPGDELDVVGYPTTAPSGPYLEDATYRFLQSGNPPSPRSVSAEDLATGRLNYDLVSIAGKLLRHVDGPTNQELLLQSGPTLFTAQLDTPQLSDRLKHLRDNSTLRITGISLVSVEGSWHQGGPTSSVVHDTIMLRSAGDVVETAPPSWWSATHLEYLAVVLGGLMLIFLALALYSRLQHWRLEGISAERERLSHEIHDTLAQSFAGIGFQLQAIRSAIPHDKPDLLAQVEVARALVRHSHKEARRSIEPTDLKAFENIDLLEELKLSAGRMLQGGGVDVSATRSGRTRPMPAAVNEALLHIGQEAMANSIRHANPSRIGIRLITEFDRVQLSVSDDGNGFVESGDLLGFGLRGMRKRADDIGAKFDVSSKPGAGTVVNVSWFLRNGVAQRSLFLLGERFIGGVRYGADKR